MLLLIFWFAMSLASFTGCAYMKGRTDQRMKLDPTYFNEIPWSLGQVSALIWPLQIVAGGLWYLHHVSANVGAGRGATIDAERKELRDLSRKFHEQQDLTWRMLTAKDIDPHNIDDNTKRALDAAAIRWSMEEQIFGPRPICAGDEQEDLVMDILNANGYEIHRDPLDLEPNSLLKQQLSTNS